MLTKKTLASMLGACCNGVLYRNIGTLSSPALSFVSRRRLVTRLELKAEDPPTTHSMNVLKQLQHLKEFNFSIDWPDSDPRFWDTVQALTQVKRLRIYPAISVDKPRIRQLRQQRPDMEVIIDHVFKLF
ncbi:predicted protein [Lichtheimia corymbifera JMRC:FSU:9682]|uniref:Uncharacterized protein n=1 Tax=Lichtheimia corymbifera JMRC:FSU:9682 TaxID=1263082 RepID=A0A068S0S2_9FUNG|nr:predicted protein [Lichtheimia corymbifera JMRC:FSU:9682]